jgi:predicted MFS family arabinose efflux permease
VATNRRTLTIVICAAGLVLAIAVGTRQIFGLFLVPISTDLGWGREVFSLAIALQNLIWGFAQPFTGMAADRWGARPVIAVAGLVYALGLYLMATPAGAGDLYLSAGVLVGLALSGSGFVIVMGAVGRVAGPANRGRALGIVGACGSLGQFAMAPIGQSLINQFGWSHALLIMAALGVAIACLSAAVPGPSAQDSSGRAQSPAAAFYEAVTHRGYLFLSAGFFVCGFQITFIIGHLPAYLRDIGLDVTTAATALGLIGLFNIAGSLVWGFLGDRFRKKYMLSLLYLGRAIITVLLLLLPPVAWNAYLFTAVAGFLWLGTIPLTSALIADIFGPRYLASLFGLTFLSHQLGSFLGIWLGGYLFDTLGSYDLVWWIIAALGLAAAALHMPINDAPLQRPQHAPQAA